MRAVRWVVCWFVLVVLVSSVFALSDGLVLEAEQRWDTYSVGSTCISGSNNLFVGNVDGDSNVEIVTGGSSYRFMANGSAMGREAPLRIWNWNGKDVTLEYQLNWPGNINSVNAADVDGDGKVELLTSGTVRNETGSYASLRVWSCEDEEIKLRSSVEGISVSAVFVHDVDQDGKKDILTVGRFSRDDQYGARLCLWHFGEEQLSLENTVEWCISNVTSVSSLFAHDLNNDEQVEIVTGGYAYPLANSSGQLRVWQFDDQNFNLKASEEWRLIEGVYALTIAGGIQGNTIVNNVRGGDIDGDGTSEIVTGGFAYDGENVNAQLRIWHWNGKKLLLIESTEWATDYLTEIKCIALEDVDGDSKLEIVTSGLAGAKDSFANDTATPNLAELRVWSWDGTTLTLKHSKDWTVDDGATAWNVGIRDVDGDGVNEIVTVGCVGLGKLCDPNMRIWSVCFNSPAPILYVLAAGVSVAAILVAAIILMKRRQIVEPIKHN